MPYLVAKEATALGVGETAASFDFSIPAGHQSGDLLLAVVTQQTGGSAIAVTGGGWTFAGPAQAAQNSQRTVVIWKYAASSSEPGVELTGATNSWQVSMMVWRGVHPTVPLDVVQRTSVAASGTLTEPGITTTEDGCAVVYALGKSNTFRASLGDQASLAPVSQLYNAQSCQIVGYKNQPVAGATGARSFLAENTNRGGSTWCVAIRDVDPANPQFSVGVAQMYERLAWYGGIQGAATTVAAQTRHDTIGAWTAALTHLPGSAATIAGRGVITHALTQALFSPTDAVWSGATAINIGVSAIDNPGRWVGAGHDFAAPVDMTGKVLSVEVGMSGVSATNVGPDGLILVLQDGSGEWVAYTVTRRNALVAILANTFVLDLVSTPTLDQSASAIDWSDITGITYLYHRRTTSTTAVGFRVKNLLLHSGINLVEGCAGSPTRLTDVGAVLQGWGQWRLAGLQGAGQVVPVIGVQLGDGATPTYVSGQAQSLELPLRPAPDIIRRWWQVHDQTPACDIRIIGSADDVFDFRASIVATDVRQRFILDVSSSVSASYDFRGSTLAGWQISGDCQTDMVSALLLNCEATLTGTKLQDCSVINSNVITANPLLVEGCSFEAGSSGLPAVELTSPGTFDFIGNSFVGYGNNDDADAAIFNDSGGHININLGLGDPIPTVVNGTGATTTISAPSIVTINMTGSDLVEMRRESDDVVLETRTGAGVINCAAHIGEEVYFTRVSGGRDIASSFPSTVVITTGDNGTISLFVGNEIQVAEVTSLAIDFTPVFENQEVLNEGVKKASLLIPHNDDLPND